MFMVLTRLSQQPVFLMPSVTMETLWMTFSKDNALFLCGSSQVRKKKNNETASDRPNSQHSRLLQPGLYLFTQKAKKYLSTKGKSQETAIPWIFILKVIWASFSFDFIIIYLCFLNLWLAKTHKLLLPHFRFRQTRTQAILLIRSVGYSCLPRQHKRL